MKKILVFLLAILTLIFVACGKDKDIREFFDKEKISSEFNIVDENKEYFEFEDKDENRDVYRIFIYEKMLSVDFKNPKKIDSLEEAYTERGSNIIYNFDDSKTTLGIMVAVGSVDELSKNDLLEILKEAKAFIK